MKRTIILVGTAALAAASGACLLGLWVTLARPVASADDGAATASVVRRFYAAVNDAIATGDSAPLETIAAVGFVARGVDDGGDDENLTDLRARLVALRAAQPGLRIHVRNVVAGREQAVAHVALEGLRTGVPLVVPATGSIATGLTDRFWFSNNRVIEYAGAVAGFGAPTSLAAAVIEVRSSPAWLALARLTFAPGAGTPALVGPGPLVYAVEAGTLAVRLDGEGRITRVTGSGRPDPGVSVVRGEVALGAGDAIALGPGSSHALRNGGAAPVTLLATTLLPASALTETERPDAVAAVPSAGMPPFSSPVSPSVAIFVAAEADGGTAWPDGVAVAPLAAERVVPTATLLPTEKQLAVGRLVLPPGTSGWLPGDGETTLIVAEAGAAVVAASAPGSNPAPASLLGAGGAAAWTARSTRIASAGDDALVLLVATLGGPEGTSVASSLPSPVR